MRIDVCTCEKRENDCTKASDVIDPRCKRQTYRIAGNSTDDDFK